MLINNNKIIMSMPLVSGDKISQIFVSYFTKPDLIVPLYGCVESNIAPE